MPCIPFDDSHCLWAHDGISFRVYQERFLIMHVICYLLCMHRPHGSKHSFIPSKDFTKTTRNKTIANECGRPHNALLPLYTHNESALFSFFEKFLIHRFEEHWINDVCVRAYHLFWPHSTNKMRIRSLFRCCLLMFDAVHSS